MSVDVSFSSKKLANIDHTRSIDALLGCKRAKRFENLTHVLKSPKTAG